MDDLIRREDAIKAVSEPFDRKYWQYTTRSIRDTVKALKDIPSAEKQGEWISNHDGYWNCSECGLRVLIYAKGNYCPNCGARMFPTQMSER